MSDDVARLRLLSQRIEGRRLVEPVEVVRWMGALQAQAYQEALWAVGLRTRTAARADVERALAERTIVRTWLMRGTLHFAPAQDVRWMQALLAPRLLAREERRRRQLELDGPTVERASQLLQAALGGGRRLTRTRVMQLLEDADIRTGGQRGYHLLWYLAQTSLLCQGPVQEKQQTFVLLDEWVPDARQLSGEAALAELARRYITSHGPATVRDFAAWTGLTLAEARAGFAANRQAFLVARLDGQEYWLAGAGDSQAEAPAGVQLLPGFDEYLPGYRDRSAVLAAEHASRIVPGHNGVFLPMVVIDGQVGGTWERRQSARACSLLLKAFLPLADVSEEVERAARRYTDFPGLPLSAARIVMA